MSAVPSRPRLACVPLEDRTVPTILPGPLPTDWAAGAGGHQNLYTGLEWFDESTVVGGSWSWSPANSAANNGTFNGYDDWRLPTLSESLAAARDQAAVAAGFLGNEFGPQVPYWTATPGSKIQGRQTYWVVHFREPSRDPGQEKETNLALLMTVRDPAKMVDDGGAGFATTGTWATTAGGNKPKPLAGYLGDARTAAPGAGTATATWTFAGLEPGATYKVAVAWTAATGYAPDAPFTVLDDSTDLGTVTVNQAAAPDDFEVAGQMWEGLGAVTTDTGTLKVRLSNVPTGKVIADAVRVFRVAPAPSPLTAAGAPAAGTGPAALTEAQLRPIVREAVRRWNATGLTAAERSLLKTVTVRLADLDGATLGQAAGATIALDPTAAGHGWFVDPTPRSDSEFRHKRDQGERGKMDLLTAVVHELGHVLGRDHGDGAMSETLAAGTRPSIVPGVWVGHPAAPVGPGWFLSSGRSHR